MTALIKKLYASDVVRYVFFGGCTTLVNLVSFFLLRQAGVQRDFDYSGNSFCLCGKL